MEQRAADQPLRTPGPLEWIPHRVYYIQDGDVLILLLCGGGKSTQQKDIDKAHRLANEWRSDMKEASDEQQE